MKKSKNDNLYYSSANNKLENELISSSPQSLDQFSKINSNLNEADSYKLLKEISPNKTIKTVFSSASSSSSSTKSFIPFTSLFNMRNSNYNSKYNNKNNKYNNNSNNNNNNNSSYNDHNNNSKKYNSTNSNSNYYNNCSSSRRNSYSNSNNSNNNNYNKFQKNNRHYVENSTFVYKNNDVSNYENRKLRKDTQSSSISSSSSSGQNSSKSSNLDSNLNSNNNSTIINCNTNDTYDNMDAKSLVLSKDRKQTKVNQSNKGKQHLNSACKTEQETYNNPVTPIFNVNFKGHQFQPPPFQPAAYHHNNKLNLSNHSNNNNINGFKMNQLLPHHHNHNHVSHPHHHNHHHHHHHHHTQVQHNHSHHGQINQQNNIIQQKNKILIEKYDRKYNLISFILLRKNDEYLVDNKYYLNDQTLYQQVDVFIEKRDLNGLISLFLNENLLGHSQQESFGKNSYFNSLPNLSNFTNSYNCNLFVYTIRKCLENEYKMVNNKLIDDILNENDCAKKLISNENVINDTFLIDLVRFLFSKNVRPSSYYLIDGDYPKRNILHYAARYNCDLIPELLLESFRDNCSIDRLKKEESETDDEECLKKTIVHKEEEESEDEDEEDINAADDENDDVSTEKSDDEDHRESHKDNNDKMLRFKNGEFVFAQLCMQTDFNENTPIHSASLNNSFKFFKLVNPICIKHSQYIYNEDGLNPFLLACRHSSVQFIKHLIENFSKMPMTNDETESDNDLRNLLICVDKIYSKNCLHYACGRGYGKDALDVIKFLTKLAKNLDEKVVTDINNNTHQNINSKPIFYELIGSTSALVGSVYHVAASNLTRLTTLWYLLSLYPANGIYTYEKNGNISMQKSVLDKLDFREFTTVDCLIDSVMNLREMAPSSCKILAKFYDELLMHQKIQLVSTLKFNDETFMIEHENREKTDFEDNFDVLLKRCLYKLLIELKANVYNLPRIRNQLQLIEFLKLMVFMSKFGGNYSLETTNQEILSKENQNNDDNIINSLDYTVHATRFESIYCKNFEAFCLNFLNSFLFFGDLLPLFTNSKTDIVLNSYDEQQKQNTQTLTRNYSTSSNNSTKTTPLTANTPTKSSSVSSTSSASVDELENLVEILAHLYELVKIVNLNSIYKYSEKFKVKLNSFFRTYLNSLINYHGFSAYFNAGSFSSSDQNNESTCSLSNSTDDETISNQSIDIIDNTLNQVVNNSSIDSNNASSIGSSSSFINLAKNSTNKSNCFKTKINEIKRNFEKLSSKEKNTPTNLKFLCRNTINNLLLKYFNQYQTKKKLNLNQNNANRPTNEDLNDVSLSGLSKNYLYFKLPSCYSSLINFLTYDLIKDLYGDSEINNYSMFCS